MTKPLLVAPRFAAWQTRTIVKDEIGFAILRYREKTPVLAACARCQLKFLTPAGMMKDSARAAEYLWEKYSHHDCRNAISSDEHGTWPSTGGRRWKGGSPT